MVLHLSVIYLYDFMLHCTILQACEFKNMHVTVQQVFDTYAWVRAQPKQYLAAPKSWGVATYKVPECGLEIIKEKSSIWGPVELWGRLETGLLGVVHIEFNHDDFYIDLLASEYCFEHYMRTIKHKWNGSSVHQYTLDYVGDQTAWQSCQLYIRMIQT